MEASSPHLLTGMSSFRKVCIRNKWNKHGKNPQNSDTSWFIYYAWPFHLLRRSRATEHRLLPLTIFCQLQDFFICIVIASRLFIIFDTPVSIGVVTLFCLFTASLPFILLTSKLNKVLRHTLVWVAVELLTVLQKSWGIQGFYSTCIYFSSLFCNAGNWVPGVTHDRTVLYHWTTPPINQTVSGPQMC